MSEENDSEREAREFFEALGLTAKKVQETHLPSADYRVDGDGPGYLVEVKGRNLPEQLTNRTGPFAEFVDRPMSHDGKVLEYLGDARSQLRALDPNRERLWFLWIAAESWIDADAQVERVFKTLYGFREAFDISDPGFHTGAYYAGPTALDRFPQIDAVIVYRADGADAHLAFCVNEAGDRVDAVLASAIAGFLRSQGLRPHLPSVDERPGVYVVPRGLLAREGAAAVLRFVQNATGRPMLNFWAVESQLLGAGRTDVRALQSPDGESNE